MWMIRRRKSSNLRKRNVNLMNKRNLKDPNPNWRRSQR